MGYKILIVDDSNIVRKVLMKSLRLAGLDVERILEAENGQSALDLLLNEQVDLIFLDINMPVMNGMEFMERLRKDPGNVATPVIVISTEGSRERKDTLFEREIRAYLRKPVTPEILNETVLHVLGGIEQ
ncbi:MAG TPA: response regulator [Oligoflexia bacterium]|nr:response regulator [Oligoflexia bacterium]